MEDVSLTKSGGLNLNSKKVDPKIVRVYEDEEYVLKKCVVKFFIKNMSLYLKSVKTDTFYLTPKKFPTESV